ncbi:MAG: hypothetical protein CMK65_00975 [Pseudoalteromonas sp.]|uniref:glycosyltransferase n=1 Tax=Pseudoalteromonas sp. TaxID=53249 RepID=UPI000C9727DD|nr:glycosyltransferase [Pseudoalteromonas sp.]MAD02186.1 hypothetical protein [Pseudoalteromonas sp.]|tara:strand:+ start:34377 stop:36449 length:2073 start_codon:yes stop_codon:yes gene_type:complete
MLESPCIGVYIPTKNRVELLKRAVDSVLEQTYQNFKILIVDDGSSDGTFEYLTSIDDPRVSYIRNEISEKACRARNKAIAALDTELVTGLDDDDIFLPNRLEELLKVYDPNYAFACSGYIWDYGVQTKSLFSKSKVISLSDALDLNQCSNQILVERQRLLDVGGFDAKLPALQDHDLWVRLIAKYGSAYRTGKELYIVNDDQELERISSVKNKLQAIDLFEKKHRPIMSTRNRENFAFYRKKIAGEKVSLLELFHSTQYGLFSLKVRHALTQKLERLARYRLEYLHTGKVSHPIIHWFMNYLVPLLATGGPGASRVILLSSCIFFLGATNTASFGSDFFILMLINTMFSQSFGFFLLKQDYANSFSALSKKSIIGLFVAILLLFSLNSLGVVSNLTYTLPLLVILHFYYLLRFQRIAESGFFVLALSECMISLICLIAPIILSQMHITQVNAPYLVYVIASLIGLLILLLFSVKGRSFNKKTPSLKKVFNIAISTSASIFALFCFPYGAKEILDADMASYVALCISCFSIAMLIPRTQANKSLPVLGSDDILVSDVFTINQKYTKIILVSCFISLIVASSYLILLKVPWQLALSISSIIMVIFICSQYGFIYLTTLSLHDKEGVVAKLNLMVLVATLSVLSVVVMKSIALEFMYLLLPVICIAFIARNVRAKKHIVNSLVVDKPIDDKLI